MLVRALLTLRAMPSMVTAPYPPLRNAPRTAETTSVSIRSSRGLPSTGSAVAPLPEGDPARRSREFVLTVIADDLETSRGCNTSKRPPPPGACTSYATYCSVYTSAGVPGAHRLIRLLIGDANLLVRAGIRAILTEAF